MPGKACPRKPPVAVQPIRFRFDRRFQYPLQRSGRLQLDP
jgi:hypothetical protein